ncbi:hypothetical protein CD116_07640 [Staphylococcus schweitzeri]|uniref:Uncharacterized protein n=1 Tax=Staphylococcus schweitzeri TaxID=1654388 RepID=A0A2K4AH65_9STAP|nr:hypothetical protein [Staphylococcus schweitzeri]MBE2128899.1 hypothetical protein [Staphylococcus schweitzeri]PNZ49451.1 hypothetical protein CD116_07640 [Staphylococcus schweitzeri]CDR52052.1 membrane protein [Staphylococcus schweitzeri]CDR52802.1 membrane protein [Staphylococcus schweitzeri]VEE67054.1 Uncharacterised protein [Staphylococcus schweitzeri]
MRLKVLLHFTAAIFISFMLLWMNMLIDILSKQTHLKALLLNLDFLIPSDNAPYTLEIICHLLIGSVIYFVFVLLFRTSKRLYYLCYIPLFLLFIALYPLLVFIAQRPIFQFSVTELIGWIITHIFFMSLMALVIPRIK